MDPPKVEGVSGDHRDSREICSQLSADVLLHSSNVAPSGVAVPHADRPGCQRIHGPGGVDLGKKHSSKTTGTGEYLR